MSDTHPQHGWLEGIAAPSPDDTTKCVSCGLCLPHCPTFRVTGREDASPRGRVTAMRAVQDGLAGVDETFVRMMDECLACRACETACPSGVPYGRMIEAARVQAEAARPVRARIARRAGVGWVLRHPLAIGAMGTGMAISQRLGLDRLAPTALREAAYGQPVRPPAAPPPPINLTDSEAMLRAQMMETLRRNQWQVKLSARELSMSRATFYRKLARFNIVPPNRRE